MFFNCSYSFGSIASLLESDDKFIKICKFKKFKKEMILHSSMKSTADCSNEDLTKRRYKSKEIDHYWFYFCQQKQMQ